MSKHVDTPGPEYELLTNHDHIMLEEAWESLHPTEAWPEDMAGWRAFYEIEVRPWWNQRA